MQYLYFPIEGVLEEGGRGGCDARRFPSRLQHSVGFLRRVPISVAPSKRYSGKGHNTYRPIIFLWPVAFDVLGISVILFLLTLITRTHLYCCRLSGITSELIRTSYCRIWVTSSTRTGRVTVATCRPRRTRLNVAYILNDVRGLNATIPSSCD